MIDLHIHTTASDGTDEPEELVEKVRASGLRFFSVTDHDTFSACGQMAGRLQGDKTLRFFYGIEFSCKEEQGECHVLGYGFDPAAEPIRRTVEKAHSDRMEKTHIRLQWLKEKLSVPLTPEEEEELLSYANPGKPQFGNLLVKKGLVPDRTTAIRKYVDPCPVGDFYLSPEEAIQAISRSGGIPVLAHGFFGSGRQNLSEKELRERVERLTGFGLQGLESYYSRYTPEQRDFMLRLAEEKGLYVTAGSDYHGKNKAVQLGQTGLSLGECPAPLQRFLSVLQESGWS